MQNTPISTPYQRTPDTNLDAITDFPYEPQYLEIDGLRLAYIDEGPKDAPVILMVHGMPTWSYLYRHMIKRFIAEGYRCVVPDHIGFGRSDKPTQPEWYSIAKHTANLGHLITSLNLSNVTLIVQDWGGPIGLSNYAAQSQLFSRIVIMNTWLHHDEYEYSPGALNWIDQNSPGGLFRDNIPSKFNWGSLMALATNRATAQESVFAILQGETPQLSPEAQRVSDAYDAPFKGLGEEGVSGPRRFPLSIPARGTNLDNAVAQSKCFDLVNATQLPVHFVWGINDAVFPEDWGKKWHSLIPHSTWLSLDAAHFLQDTHGTEIADRILSHLK